MKDSERQVRTIVDNLEVKWGSKIISVNIKNALAMRKKGLNNFFSVAQLHNKHMKRKVKILQELPQYVMICPIFISLFVKKGV